MKKALALMVAVFALTGCAQPRQGMQGLVSAKGQDGLNVAIEVPKRCFVQGETFQAVVHASNASKCPIVVNAPSAAPAFLGVWRYSEAGWTQIKRYPESAAQVLSAWTLAPKEARQFCFTVTVGKDWPTNEPLRLTGELNGRPELAPGVVIEVRPQ